MGLLYDLFPHDLEVFKFFAYISTCRLLKVYHRNITYKKKREVGVLI